MLFLKIIPNKIQKCKGVQFMESSLFLSSLALHIERPKFYFLLIIIILIIFPHSQHYVAIFNSVEGVFTEIVLF